MLSNAVTSFLLKGTPPSDAAHIDVARYPPSHPDHVVKCPPELLRKKVHPAHKVCMANLCKAG